MNSQLRRLSVFALVMITVGSVDSIRNLPATALFGSALIFFFIIGAIFFLVPVALVSAELASSWTEEGGVYVWVKEAFGTPLGYMAIWFQWLENVIWYPTILSFVAGTFAYLIDPALVRSKLFLITVILFTFWAFTLINCFGTRVSSWFSNVCSVFGLLIPMTLIIILGIIWLSLGHPSQIHFSHEAWLPHAFNPSMWVALTGIMMSFCGMEIATVHAREVKNPQKAFPRALLYSSLIIVTTLIFGSLSIATVLPQNQISLVSGIMQAFSYFFGAYHLTWLLPLVGVMLIIGGLGGVNNWILAPTKGLLIAAQDGTMPPHLQRENRYRAPQNLLIWQAVIVTLLTLVFLLLPTVNAAYWLLTALASQIYMIMYILMFAAGIWLRVKHADRPRAFRIPGGFFGMCLVAGFGILASIITTIVGFFPPSSIQVGSLLHYESLLVGGLIIMIVLPMVCYKLRRAHW
ncbi:MAG: amino acid permease [Gammaproteobacteria bacterium CG11_big_fil_rev_8_21_14_0_20_46_22]|nr:MAG: amino acid permease [Gammaproteobacteria bacterium CG12_big_fil_rev_8_21_14_0_65_46_12]PIR11001.1 MAG: amino acid permease [Gammaproteobacteria bacterium CG11_big_fil_rev_8_21_14_0_20_46_22]